MSMGVGVDLVYIPRLKDTAERWQNRFLNRVFTVAERDICMRYRCPYPHLAGRFAVKEAVVKALGLSRYQPWSWHDIETLNEASGKPYVRLSGCLAQYAHASGSTRVEASIAHDRDYAVAYVVIVGA